VDRVGREGIRAQGCPLAIEAARNVRLRVARGDEFYNKAIAFEKGALSSNDLALKCLEFLFS
jgi:hypothetical protein